MLSDTIQNPKKNAHYINITTRSGKLQLEPTPENIEQEKSI